MVMCRFWYPQCCNKDHIINEEEKEMMDAVKAKGRRPSVSSECVDNITLKESIYKKKVIPKDNDAYNRIKNAIEGNFIFASLEEQELKDVIDSMEEKKVNHNDVIIKEGDEGDYFYIVDKGEYEVYVSMNKNDPVCKYTTGGSFGELALMYNSPRAATVIAKSEGILWALDRETFRRIVVAANKRRAELYESLLSKMEILRVLTTKERSIMADALTLSEFKDGHVIIRQSDSNYDKFRFYIVVEGECKFSYTDPTTKEIIDLGIVKAGGYFGEKALTEKSKRAVNVIAQGNVKCLSMDVLTFERIMGPCREIFNRKIKTYASTTGNASLSSGTTKLDYILPATVK